MIRTVTIKLSDITLDVTGDYSPSTPDVWYLRNGDPGYPGESEAFEIDSIYFMDKDITQVIESMNNILCSTVRSQFNDGVNEDLWVRIESECIKELTK